MIQDPSLCSAKQLLGDLRHPAPFLWKIPFFSLRIPAIQCPKKAQWRSISGTGTHPAPIHLPHQIMSELADQVPVIGRFHDQHIRLFTHFDRAHPLPRPHRVSRVDRAGVQRLGRQQALVAGGAGHHQRHRRAGRRARVDIRRQGHGRALDQSPLCPPLHPFTQGSSWFYTHSCAKVPTSGNNGGIMDKEKDDWPEPLALSCYEAMAGDYAANIDSAPYNAFYERPAVLSLLPDVEGRAVFDAGCGPGWYAEYLVERGAMVTAVDVSPQMVAFARARLGDRAKILQADLGKPLDFVPDGAVDLVLAPLVMHYLKDWQPVFTEFGRILRGGGKLLFSTHHPTMDYLLFRTKSYFTTELVEDQWRIGKVRFYRRPLTSMIDALANSGFVIERIVEPRPTEEFRQAKPEDYEKLSTQPWFIVIRARRDREQADTTGAHGSEVIYQ